MLCWLLYLDLVLKLISVDRTFAGKHYMDLSAKPFFNGFVEYIISGPVVVMVWASKGVVTTGRKIIGATNPLESAAGTIRGDYAIDIGRFHYPFRQQKQVSNQKKARELFNSR
ncbi:Nucleoside diphosphate kinase 1 [Capsicum chinense]|nr:Nucleoside diphosphate kinase 1 [Capsicum chinense]